VPAAAGDYSPWRKYADERGILGISVGEHVMALYRPAVAGRVDADSRHVPARVGQRIRIAGVLEAHRTATTRTGGTIRFLTLDDEFGLFEATVLPRRDGCATKFNHYGPWVVAGKVEDQYGAVTISADNISLFPLRSTSYRAAAS
jgi:DNA polymerase III alpha subunit